MRQEIARALRNARNDIREARQHEHIKIVRAFNAGEWAGEAREMLLWGMAEGKLQSADKRTRLQTYRILHMLQTQVRRL